MAALILLAATTSACAEDEPPARSEEGPSSLAAPDPADGEFEHGRFRFGRAYSGGPGDENTVAAYAWDIVSYLDGGEIGSWSAGYRVFESSDQAEERARELAHRWPCADEPAPLEGIDAEGYDFLEGSFCRGLLGEGRYVAQVSGAQGDATVNLVVGGPSARSAMAAAVAVWDSLVEAVEPTPSAS